RVSDAAKSQGNDEELYAGVILKGNLSNNIDDFTLVNIGGAPKYLQYVDGDGQYGTIGQALPGSLIVRVTDENRIPVSDVAVDYRVVQGSATLDLAPADNNVRIEAESGSLTPPMTIGFDDNASGGRYIHAPSGLPKQGKAEYTVNLPVSGTYNIWGRIYAPSGLEDSFFFVVDVSPDTLTWHLMSPYNRWRWARFDNQGVPFSQTLAAGQHKFSIIKREDNARIDKFIFSSDPNFSPSGFEEVPAYLTDINGEARAELTLGTTVGNIIVQAEVPGLEGSPVVFSDLWARAGDAVKMQYVSGNNQTGNGGQLLAEPFKVQLFDEGDNPVFGWQVTFQDSQGGGFPSNTQPVLSDAEGIAQTNWTLGTENANNIVHAISESLLGSPVVFNATAVGGVADSMMYV
ncbi:MAG: hypothetical protein SCK70_16815, partial [bacterium]|nr:hypothetical protein [bacterium]